MTQRNLWPCFLPFLLAAGLAGAASPGGQGILRPTGGMNQPHCFKTSSAIVPEVCGSYEVHWKLWALMGEPVGNYGLVWSIKSVRLRNGDGKGSQSYPLGALPSALGQAAQRSELSLEGLAFVQNAAKLGTVAVAFDTGAPARPDGKPSFNVPGSPDWSAFLINGSGNGRGMEGWCDRADRRHVPADAAKALMRDGIQLGSLQVCARSTAQADALERAIEKHCAASPQAAFCEKKQTPAALDVLDRAQDKDAIRRKREEMAQAFQRNAEAACTRDLAPLQACVQQACPRPQGPPEATCTAIPNRPFRMLGAVLTSRSNAPCDAACERQREQVREERRREREREDEELSERQAAWDTQWATLARQCEDDRQARVAQARCTQGVERQCNPTGLTAQSCLQNRMAAAPSDSDAAAAFQQDVRTRTQAGKRPAFLD